MTHQSAARLGDEVRPLDPQSNNHLPSTTSRTTPLEEVGELTLKGLTQPVVAYNVPLAVTQPAPQQVDLEVSHAVAPTSK
jgi:hypothetical protein